MNSFGSVLSAMALACLAGGPASGAPITLSMSMLTWNTEYYWPKAGDYNALLRANEFTQQQVCDSQVVSIFLQEVAAGYIDEATCQGEDGDKPFSIFRADFMRAVSKCPEPVAWAVKCKCMRGYIGTKASLGKTRVNAQVAVTFYREEAFEVDIFIRSVSFTEKGGVMVQVTEKDSGAKAVAIGVHLDANEESARNLQICKIVKRALKNTATLEGPVFEGHAKCQGPSHT